MIKFVNVDKIMLSEAIGYSMLIVIALSFLYYLYKFLSLSGLIPQFGSHNTDGPIISSQGMLEARGLDALHKGVYGNFKSHFLVNSQGRVIVFVELGRNTNMHLIAIGDKSGINNQIKQLSKKFLTKVQLEGDFPSYFKMYCTPEKQVELRQVFEPVTMAAFANFCRAYDFEIFHDSLYISQAEYADHREDTTTMVTDILKFLNYHQKLLNRI